MHAVQAHDVIYDELRVAAVEFNMANPCLRVFPPEKNGEHPFMQQVTGVKNIPQRLNPVGYFKLLFSMNLLLEITRQTNR